MAKSRISRSRKRDLNDPDEFVSFWNKLFGIVTEHKVKISLALGLVCVLVIVAAGTVYFLKRSENKAFNDLQKSIVKYQTLLKNNDPTQAYQGVEKNFQQIMDNYSGRRGGKLAGLVYANICYTAKNYDKAIALYNKSLIDFNDELFIKHLIVTSLGYAYEAKKDYKTAIRYFEMIVSSPDYNFKDEALFNLGELYSAMGNNNKSINAFKTILSEHSGSIYTEIAKERVKG